QPPRCLRRPPPAQHRSQARFRSARRRRRWSCRSSRPDSRAAPIGGVALIATTAPIIAMAPPTLTIPTAPHTALMVPTITALAPPTATVLAMAPRTGLSALRAACTVRRARRAHIRAGWSAIGAEVETCVLDAVQHERLSALIHGS